MLLAAVPKIPQTNSHAASKRGSEQFARGQYDAAVKSFADAAALKSTPETAFNLGTAQIAAGKRAEGANTLDKAMENAPLRAETLYNRGNSALASKAYELAIRDYVAALKLNPKDAAAKRNLEIALQQNQSQQSRGSQPQQQQQPQQQKPQPQPSQANQQREQKQQESDAESLLRSVQQQEQEELARMKKARGEAARIGW
jgi:tetratricopeptide (TPR) repeat protein